MRKKAVTLSDIARETGVSVNAVSLALRGKSGVSEEVRRHITHVADKMGYALRGAGAEAALRSRNRGYAIDVNAVDCDYYRLLDGDPAARRAFAGEYMHRYSWAESTCAWLLANYGRRR